MDAIKAKLMEAEEKAALLFKTAEERGLIVAGKTEKQLNEEMFVLAKELFDIEKYWHKRLIRSGRNTLQPYHVNPPTLTLQEDDILFFDFGPIFEDFEADLGRTYVIGNDPLKRKLKNDIEKAWQEARDWFHARTSVTGAGYYEYIIGLTRSYGWEYGGEMAGHLIGHFPHEKLEKGNYGLYVHPGNPHDMYAPDAEGNKRHWILEMHFVDREREIGGFYEQLLT